MPLTTKLSTGSTFTPLDLRFVHDLHPANSERIIRNLSVNQEWDDLIPEHVADTPTNRELLVQTLLVLQAVRSRLEQEKHSA